MKVLDGACSIYAELSERDTNHLIVALASQNHPLLKLIQDATKPIQITIDRTRPSIGRE